MKKSFAVVFAISILLSFVACGKENTETSSKIQSKAESKMSSNAEPNLESKAESKHDKLSADSVSNKTKIPETNITFDSNYAFLGNSLFGDLDEYELVDNADVYSYIGMNVATVFDQKLDKHKKPMLDEMLSKDYKTIFIMFGMNEVGWSYPDIFTDDYAELVDEIHSKLPDAKIYLLSITPITQSLEAKGEDGMNSETIANSISLYKRLQKNIMQAILMLIAISRMNMVFLMKTILLMVVIFSQMLI